MIKTYNDIAQGSPEWHALRCGLLTASEVKHIITPAKLQFAANDKCRSHVYELLGQRITGYVEPSYISDDMLRGRMDEVDARELYHTEIAEVLEVGFVTNDEWGFTLGYSPDGLVGDEGLIEIKGRCQKYQIETIITNEVPQEYMLQIQTGLLVTGRKWCDFLSYCGGLPMYPKRVYADAEMQGAIIRAATEFELKIAELRQVFEKNSQGLIPTERREETEIVV